MAVCSLVNSIQRLPILYGPPVINQSFHNYSANLSQNIVHDFDRLDITHILPGLNLIAEFQRGAW